MEVRINIEGLEELAGNIKILITRIEELLGASSRLNPETGRLEIPDTGLPHSPSVTPANPSPVPPSTDTNVQPPPAPVAAPPAPVAPPPPGADHVSTLERVPVGAPPVAVPVAPPPPAPVQQALGEPQVAAPAVAGGAQVDARNLPWDQRIHASSKAILASGNWRAKRGVDANLVAQVEAELSGAAALPAGAPGYVEFCQRTSQLVGSQTLTTADILNICGARGLPDAASVATRPDLVPVLLADLDARAAQCTA